MQIHHPGLLIPIPAACGEWIEGVFVQSLGLGGESGDDDDAGDVATVMVTARNSRLRIWTTGQSFCEPSWIVR